MEEIVRASHLGKKYKTNGKLALQDVSFSVKDGEIIGVLGPNGAGKSTLIKILLGVIRPTDGIIEVKGVNPQHFKKKHKREIGVFLGGKSNLIFHLPVIESVRLFQKIYKVPKAAFEKSLAYYSEMLECKDFLEQRVSTLSLGQKLRAELLCILIYEPSLLVLDEPTLGLDIEGKRKLREIIKRLVSDKKLSVLITTHDVNDMEKLCSRIMMIKEGKKILDIRQDEFDERLEKHEIVVTDYMCEEKDGIHFLEEDGLNRRYLVERTQLSSIRKKANEKQCDLWKTERPRLEDLFYEYYT